MVGRLALTQLIGVQIPVPQMLCRDSRTGIGAMLGMWDDMLDLKFYNLPHYAALFVIFGKRRKYCITSLLGEY